MIVRGTCNEAVLIDRDDVTLQGDPASAGVLNAPPAPAIAVTVRAMRVVIDHLTVYGGMDGIYVYGVFDTTITNTVIQNAARWGIAVKNGHAFVSGSTVEGSGSDGISLQRGSLRLKDSQIRSNRGAGAAVGMASGLNASGSTIASNGSNGIQLLNGSEATIHGSTIASNGTNPKMPGHGLSVVGGSNAEIGESTITANAGAGVDLSQGSILSASNNTISSNGSNGVQAFDRSQASFSSNTITANGANAANDVNFRNGVAVFFSDVNLYGNQIANHPASGVRITVSTLNAGDNTITGNAEGVLLFLASQLVMHTGNTISYNRGFGLWVNANSTAQVSGAKILFNAGDGIVLQWDSKLLFFVEGATTSGGNGGYGLRCPDAESSVGGLQLFVTSPPNGAGDVSPTCTRY